MNDSFARIAHLEENSPCQTSGYNQQREELPMFHVNTYRYDLLIDLDVFEKERERGRFSRSLVRVCVFSTFAMIRT